MAKPADTSWVVHKFGGTSVANAERYRTVAQIVGSDPNTRKGIVVSAMSGVTDRLIELLELARKQDSSYVKRLEELKQKHITTIQELLSGESLAKDLVAQLETDCGTIADLLRAVSLGRSYSEQIMELIAGHGELWSARMMNGYLQSLRKPSICVDARQVLVVSPGETGTVIDWETSKRKLDSLLRSVTPKSAELLVITGYIASTPDGVATTLKRNGSDFSASIFGALLDSSCITIWTDVDGVLSADPRKVPEAVVLDEMSYQEAVELAYFGAKVIHPHTMAPALKKGIPIWIRNTFNPTFPGTKIHQPEKGSDKPKNEKIKPVKGFATVDQVALVNLEGTGMIGVPGVASRLFGSLREVGVSVIMISQASSEHSVCFAVPEAQGTLARATVEKAFSFEIQQGQIQSVDLLMGSSILAAVGDNMVEVPGVAARFFQSLGKAGVSIRAIAQGSSERNISVVVDRAQATRALRAVHAGFYLSPQTLSVGILGLGTIGSTLLNQIETQSEWLKSQFKIDIRVRGIADSKKMLLSENPKKSEVSSKGIALDRDLFTRHIRAEHLPHFAIIDCTSSEEVAGQYTNWLEQGIHVITPNKKANSGSMEMYRKLRTLGRETGVHYLYEATVGAGLPVINTLRDLVQTGDQVLQIEGIFSGTLSYIFNTFGEGVSFSSVVMDAKKKGYTEPDPRDDLSGKDVARKLIILGREIGLDLELKDVAIQSLVPPALQSTASPDEFLAQLPKFDAEMARLQSQAEAQNEVLRYVGIVTKDGKASVELKRYPKTHSFSRIQGTDNIIAFTTSRYRTQPLIVQGPGAGPEVTAGGVFADLLRLAAYVGAS